MTARSHEACQSLRPEVASLIDTKIDFDVWAVIRAGYRSFPAQDRRRERIDGNWKFGCRGDRPAPSCRLDANGFVGRQQGVFRTSCAYRSTRCGKRLCRSVRHSTDIEDVLQDAYLKIWRHASRFDPDRASPISWMSVIVRNTAIDAVRPVRIPTTDLDDAAIRSQTLSRQDGRRFRLRPCAARSRPKSSAGFRKTVKSCCRWPTWRAKAATTCRALRCSSQHDQDLAAPHTGGGQGGLCCRITVQCSAGQRITAPKCPSLVERDEASSA